ncbi:MAG: redoxin domain-containing protein [Anaerolineae bacterium]|nr:redoxin domain-containing protein [Anaerolineae bacterium]
MSILKAGTQAPEFSLRDVQGETRTLNASTSPLSLVIFFKTSCPTCCYAWKYYERLHTAYADAGLRVLGISQHDSERTEHYRVQNVATFPHLLDADFTVSREYDPAFVPTGFLIDSNGTIVETFESWNSRALTDFSERVADRLGIAAQPIIFPDDNAVPAKIG